MGAMQKHFVGIPPFGNSKVPYYSDLLGRY